MIRPVHPFPARMAPDLAIYKLKELPGPSRVLDPMAGSGTVLRHAAQLGHEAIGFDLDPLAVLMSRVWTTPIRPAVVECLLAKVLTDAAALNDDVDLPWIDNDIETRQFTEFWFADPQRQELRRLAWTLNVLHTGAIDKASKPAVDLLRLGLSRIIITKSNGASLAHDVSHSRPHRAKQTSTYDVFDGYQRSVMRIVRQMKNQVIMGRATVVQGDARAMDVQSSSIDLVLTSPPYLNAIDYMRGHRLALVWLGYRVGDLRTIRADSIGAERALASEGDASKWILAAMCEIDQLPSRERGMVARFAEDLRLLLQEIARVLKANGKVTLVVGNSKLRGVFIRNADAAVVAAQQAGLQLVDRNERDLPTQSRYLPPPSRRNDSLGKRMRTESVLTLARGR